MSPFETLGLAPTLDGAAVKRAYFQKLPMHQPQADPDGFRRLRAAYEVLTAPGGLAAAYLSAPLDLDAELAALSDLDAPLRAAERDLDRERYLQKGEGRFIDCVSRMSLRDALVWLDGQPAPGR